MAIVRCPHCDAALTLTEWDTGRCPACKQPLDEAPVHSRYRRDVPDISYGGAVTLARWSVLPWATTRTGLALVGVGTAVALACYVIVRLIYMHETDIMWRVDSFLYTFLSLLAIGFAAGITVLIVGSWLCCAVPTDSRQRAWTIATLITQILVGLLLFVMMILAAQLDLPWLDDRPDRFDGRMAPAWRGGVTPRTLQLMSYVVYFAIILSKTFFTCFLAGVTGYFHAWGLRISMLIYLGLAMLVDLTFFLLYVLQYEGGLGFQLVRALFWIRLALYTPLLVWFIVQTFLVRSVITDALTRNWASD